MARISTTAAPQRPDLDGVVDKLVQQIEAILQIGLPIEDGEAEQATHELSKILQWRNHKVPNGEYATGQIRAVLCGFADKSLRRSASRLFEVPKGCSSELAMRQIVAAKLVGVSREQFVPQVQPRILRIMAWQLAQKRWPTTAMPLKEDRKHNFPFRVIAVVLLLAASATTSAYQKYVGASSEAAIRAGSFAIALFIAAWPVLRRYLRRFYNWLKGWYRRLADRPLLSKRPDSRVLPRTILPDPQLLLTYLREAGERLTQSRIATPLLVDMLLSPATYRTRTVETISLEGHSVRQHVSLEFSFSDVRTLLDDEVERLAGENQAYPERLSLYVPVLVPMKGELIDRLQIKRSDGSLAASLSYSQSLRVLSLGLHYLLVVALAERVKDATSFNDPDFVKAELGLLQVIALRGSRKPKKATRAVKSAMKLLVKRFGVLPAQLEQVKCYVLHLSERYPIIVSLPYSPQPRRRLEYERIIPRSLVAKDAPSRARLWLGLRPHRVEVPVSLASQTDSYHLEVVGPLDHYVRAQFLGCSVCRKRITPRWRKITSSTSACDHAPVGVDSEFWVRVRYKAGQNYAHAYMRDFLATGLDASKVEMEVVFAESPPGVEERALAASVTATIALGVVGYVFERSGSVAADVAAIFLALPGFAATWFGFTSDADTVLRSSFGARLSLIVTGFLSLAGLSIYLLEAEKKKRPVWPTAHWGLLGVHDGAWMALLAISLLNTLAIAWISLARLRNFVRVATTTR